MGNQFRLKRLLSSVRRYYSCEVDNKDNGREAMKNLKWLYHSRQKSRILGGVNLRELQVLKEEIISKSKQLTSPLVENVTKGIWPMLRYNREVRFLVMLKQKYLALLSRKYGLHSAQVETQVCS